MIEVMIMLSQLLDVAVAAVEANVQDDLKTEDDFNSVLNLNRVEYNLHLLI